MDFDLSCLSHDLSNFIDLSLFRLIKPEQVLNNHPGRGHDSTVIINNDWLGSNQPKVSSCRENESAF